MSKTQPETETFFKDISATLSRKGHPPVEQWDPPFCGDIDMRIAVDGSWYYQGSLIRRQKLVQLFASVLRKEADGKTYLVTPSEKLGITVEDAPFLVVDVQIDQGKEPFILAETNIGDRVFVGKDHPLRIETIKGQPRPYLHVRGRLEALINRPCFYRLVDVAEIRKESENQSLWIKTKDRDFCLGSLPCLDGE